MTYVLFPGRHHVLTAFQEDYLRALCERESVDAIVFAVTSSNHSRTRRNPFPGHRREAAIEQFAGALPVPVLVFHIDDLGTTDRFADYVVKTIAVESRGRVELSPDNTVVACSTPSVIELYEQLGYRIAPVELGPDGEATSARPWELLVALANGTELPAPLAAASASIVERYDYSALLADIYDNNIVSDDGDLTETRDYNVYVRAFDEGAARKSALVADYVRPGRIVDVGCCTGSVIEQLTRIDRLRESDFYGIEIARTLYAECIHRKNQGAFHNDHVWFYQRDFTTKPIFSDNSVDTVLSFSLTHEVESYSGRDALRTFVELVHRQLAPGGRWVNVDVIGPTNPDELIALWLRDDDGLNTGWDRPLEPLDKEGARGRNRDYLAGLSTRARFHRFANDFHGPIDYEIEGDHIVTTARNATEYLTKKDYLDNWQSEMHERFCYFAEADWHRFAKAAGFEIHPASHTFTNPWIRHNRFKDVARLLSLDRKPLPYPPTTIVLLADKPR